MTSEDTGKKPAFRRILVLELCWLAPASGESVEVMRRLNAIGIVVTQISGD